MTNQDAPLLDIRDLNVGVKANGQEKIVVQDFSLTVQKGETVGIVGESGSGKTMTMLALTRLLPAQAFVESGTIELHSHDLRAMDSSVFGRTIAGQKIAMIFQEPMTALNPVYKIGRQLTETLLFRGGVSRREAHARAIDMLEKVQLPEPELRMNQYPHQLSGGQRQRVMIAMALMGEPDLLIADEPTTALDVTVQDEIIDLLLSLQKSLGMAMIFISHDLGVVSRVSERIIVMQHGNVVERGATSKVLTSPTHPYTQGLLSCLWKLEDGQGSAQEPEQPVKIAVSARNLSKTYHLRPGVMRKARAIHALRDTSFEVISGETLAIVGESGSGKSTLARILNGLLSSDGGSVEIEGVALEKIPPLERARLIQPIFQDPYSTLNPVHTIGYTIARPLMIHQGIGFDEAKEKVFPILDSVGLSADYFNRFPNQLSGGQRQRVAIARAIILKPKILICDEPTSALDVSVQEQILDLLIDLREQLGVTMIVISHDMAVIGYLSSRVFVMHEGEIVEEGPTEQVLNNPSEAYTKQLMSAVYKVPRPDGAAGSGIGAGS